MFNKRDANHILSMPIYNYAQAGWVFLEEFYHVELTVQIGVSVAKTLMKMNGIFSLGVASYMKCGVQLT